MAVTAESVIVELEARLDRFNADTKTAATTFDAAMGRINKSALLAETATQKVGQGFTLLKAAAAGFAAALTVDKVFELAKNGLEYAASLGEIAQQLGVSTRRYQELSFAATQAGIDQGTLDSALAKLTKTLGDAKLGTTQAVDAFAALGITQKELQSLSPDDALRRVADALAKIEDPAKRAAIEVDLLGRSGQKLDTILAGGTKGLDEYAAAANRLGIVLSDGAIANADKAADDLAAVQKVLSANVAGFISANAQAIVGFAQALLSVASAAIGAAQKVADFYEGSKKIREEQGVLALLGTGPDGRVAAGQGIRIRSDLLGSVRAFASSPETTPSGPGGGGGGGGAKPAGGSPRPRAAAKPELTPAQQRLNADVSPALSSLLADANAPLADLDGILAKFEDIKGVAVDLSNVDIIDQAAIDASDRFSTNLARNLGQALVYGQSLGDALINSIKAAAAELLASGLLSLLKGDGSGGGLIGGIVSLFGAPVGAKALGGPVAGGRPYLVGERGPELYVPSGAGKIMPAGSFGGGSGLVINQYLNVSLAGNAATREDAMMFARVAYEQALAAVNQSQQFGVPSV